MTCLTNAPRSVAEIVADILECQESIRNVSDAEAARRLRNVLKELTWEETQSLEREDRARLEALYPVEL